MNNIIFLFESFNPNERTTFFKHKNYTNYLAYSEYAIRNKNTAHGLFGKINKFPNIQEMEDVEQVNQYIKESITYSDITDNPIYQAILLTEFIDYLQKFTLEEGYVSTRILINNFTDKRQVDEETKNKISNFLKKSIIQTGFVDKYIENITVYVTHKNNKELEK